MSGNKLYLLIGIVILILVAGGTVFFLMNVLSSPDLPPASPTTQTPTTPTPTTPTPTTGNDNDTDGDGSEVDDFVDTSSDVAEGVITNLCGVDEDEDGIDVDAEGTCGKCENLEGTDGSCEPGTGEFIAVIGCEEKTGVTCEIADGELLETDIDTLVYASDFAEDACTIQMNVYEEGTDPEDEDAEPIDYLVFQNDECDTDTPGTGTDAQCGDACISDSECPTDNVCSASGTCVIDECNSDPTKCMEGDLCELEDTDVGEGTDEEPEVDGTAQCGDACQATGDCAGDNACEGGKCVASFCVGGNCADGCTLPETALINDDVDRVLLGFVIAIIGILAIKTNFHVKLFYALGGRFITAQFSTEEQDRLNQEVAAYEEYKKEQQLEKSKESREEFEEAFKEKLDK
jgi:hypothetical protein